MIDPLPFPFDVLPAIDLRGGRVVRLEQGDFERETSFGDDPVAVAVGFVESGASRLHVVDLDGARAGRPVQAATIERIVTAVGDRAQVEVAGGLRTEDSVAAALSTGAARVVLGTAALNDPSLAGRLVARHGSERVVVALDVRNGRAVGEGWRSGAAGSSAREIMRRLADEGVTTFEATAIERDGQLSGPDLTLLSDLTELGLGRVIASGGIATMDDVDAVRLIGCHGVIIGLALYRGRLDLAQVLDRVRASGSGGASTPPNLMT
ncbi:MAG: 1-(5-phosphoribosyl)-5-[(5-phosphoribosylamino)methylideneamino] imidazole-4-carboxamide isomerase [Candidatus Limnocylindrales bacterium]